MDAACKPNSEESRYCVLEPYGCNAIDFSKTSFQTSAPHLETAQIYFAIATQPRLCAN